MTNRVWICLLGAFFLLAASPQLARAITANQVDDFQSGTLQNWSGGSNPTNIATGGPAGTGDTIFFAPPLVVTAAEVDRIISVTRDAVKAVLGV